MKFPTITNITEIRRAPKKVFDTVIYSKQPTYVVRNSKAMGVILDTATYEALLAVVEQHELMEDFVALEQAIRTSSGKFLTHKEFEAALLKE